jgi:2-enoate reductase
MRGDIEDIVPCISCNECAQSIYSIGRIACTVNPLAGSELNLKDKMERKRSPKRVVVVGGGVAGMSCAITAANLNYKVTLFEQQNFLGGLLRMAMLAPNRDTLPRLLAYFEKQVQKSGVEVRLGTSLTLAEARELRADAFVVATGATPLVSPISGVDRVNVMLGIEALQHPSKVGQRCVIYGGGLLAVELADLLMTQDKHQIMLIVRSDILKKANIADRMYYSNRLKDSGVEVLRNTQIVEIRPTGVVIEPPNHWKREILDVDTVIIATGWRPLDQLATELSASGFKTITIGDALEPRKLLNAIHEGMLAALDV